MPKTGLELPLRISPIPPLLFKKCFLYVLYRSLSLTKRPEQYLKLLLVDVAQMFAKKLLSKEEFEEGQRAILELKRDGYIKLAEGRSDAYLLTDKGAQVARLPIRQMKVPSVDIFDVVTSPSLVFKIYKSYFSGEYENSITNALKVLEVTIRTKAGLPNSAFGKELIEAALDPEKGLLAYPKATTKQERRGFYNLILGVFGIIRNPSGHRFVEYSDPNDVIRIIGFINYLLDLVNQCQLRKGRS